MLYIRGVSLSTHQEIRSEMSALDLLAGPTDDHIFAGLLLLPKINPPPSPSVVFDKLTDNGTMFVVRLVETYNRRAEETKENPGAKSPTTPPKKSPAQSNSPIDDVSNYPTIALNVVQFLCKTNETNIVLALHPLSAPLCKYLKNLVKIAPIPGSSPHTRNIQIATNFMGILLQAVTSLSRETATKVINLGTLSKTLHHHDLVPSLFALKQPSFGILYNIDPASITVSTLEEFILQSTSLDETLKILLLFVDRSPDPTTITDNQKLCKSLRAVLTLSMKQQDSHKSSTKHVALVAIGRLFEAIGGGWSVDKRAENDSAGKEIQVFVRVSCGEIRILLAEMLAEFETEGGSKTIAPQSEQSLAACVKIFVMAVKFLCEILDEMDEDENNSGGGGASRKRCAWSALPFETILHVKNSLSDGLDSFLQFLCSDVVQSSPALRNVAINHCVRPIGAWYAESEYEEGAYMRSNVACAFERIILMCGDDFFVNDGGNKGSFEIGEVDSDDECDDGDGDGDGDGNEVMQGGDEMQLSPLFYLLPALANLFAPHNNNPTTEFIAQTMLENKGTGCGDILEILLRFLSSSILEKNAPAVYWISDVLEGFSAHVTDLASLGIKVGSAMAALVDMGIPDEGKVSGGLPHVLRCWINIAGKTGRMTDEIQRAGRKAGEIIFGRRGEGMEVGDGGSERGIVDCAMACDANSHIFSLISDEVTQGCVLQRCLYM